jgi:hypothetical protein
MNATTGNSVFYTDTKTSSASTCEFNIPSTGPSGVVGWRLADTTGLTDIIPVGGTIYLGTSTMHPTQSETVVTSYLPVYNIHYVVTYYTNTPGTSGPIQYGVPMEKDYYLPYV